MSRAISCLAWQLEKAGVDAEIVFTEWNPPADRPLLLDLFALPKTLRHVAVRGIVVPGEYHRIYAGADERGFHSAEAGNVGLRRARGRFVTPKSSDTFLSPATIAMIARRDLDADTIYRIDRHDVAVDDQRIWELDDEALLARLAALPSVPHAWIDQSAHWGLRDLHTNACGDFLLMSSSYWRGVRGHSLDPTVLSLDIDSLVMHAAAALGARECRWPDDCRVYKPSHPNVSSSRIALVWSPWQRMLDRILSEKVSQTAALWARMAFDYPRRRVRGIDSVLGASIERNFVRPARRWARGAIPVPTQPQNWGLADVALEERPLCQAGWE
ncbi:MAG TPA: hypothetical protein VEC60_01675 [Reyranella sp.]|nr:hypothetical protein [Reyranella sp.]